MKKTNLKSPLLLFLAAVVWGGGFVAQSVGMDYVGPFTFNSVRSIVGGLVLLPVIFLLDRRKTEEEKKQLTPGEKAGAKKALLTGGICCGLCLCVASNLQQIGISYTTVGKAGFITAMYIILVPVLGIFMKRKAGIRIWISVALAVLGLYLLCMTESLALSKGDTYVLLCALAFSIHILTIDHFSPLVDGVKMSCIQFLVSGICSGIVMLLFEKPQPGAVLSAWQSILYAGVVSCGVGYTLQIVGQKGMNPTVASLILSLESVVSALAGWLILGQSLSTRELMGCVVMFAAIILAQLPEKRQTADEKSEGTGE